MTSPVGHASHTSGDNALTDSVLARKCILRHSTSGVPLADLLRSFRGQLRHHILLAVWLSPTPALAVPVGVVVTSGSEEQVTRVDADWVVAGMADELLIGDGESIQVVDAEGDAVCPLFLVPLHVPVPISGERTSPRPALVVRSADTATKKNCLCYFHRDHRDLRYVMPHNVPDSRSNQ